MGVSDHDIWAPVEPTIAGIVWNMVDSGNLVIPYVNHDPFVEKPPFYYWLAWGSARLGGGLTPGTLRLPAALLGLGCLAVVFWITRCAFDARVACVTTLLGGLTAMLWDGSHRAASDIAATFFAFLCFGLFARTLVEGPTDPRRWRRWDLAFAVTLALSFFAKNVFTFALVLPPVVVFLVLRREMGRLLRILIVTGVVLLVVLTPWLVAVYREAGWETLRIVVFDNSIGRFLELGAYAPAFTTPMSNALSAEKEPAWFYLPRLFAYPLPWTPIFLVAVVRLVRARGRWSDLDLFLLVGIVVVPLVLSLSSSKSTDYLVPILFFDLLVVGRLLAESFAGVPLLRWESWLVLGNVALGLVLIAVVPVALAAVFGAWWMLVLAPLAWLGTYTLVPGLRRRELEGGWLWRFAETASVTAIVGLAVALPAVDRTMTYQPFFDEVEPLLPGRALVTSYREVTRLPLFNYYLQRRLEVSDGFEPLVVRLEAGEPIAALVRCESVDRTRERLAAIDGLRVVREEERGRVCLLASAAVAGSAGEPAASRRDFPGADAQNGFERIRAMG